MICINCGKEIDDNSKICPFCGENTSKLKDNNITEQINDNLGIYQFFYNILSIFVVMYIYLISNIFFCFIAIIILLLVNVFFAKIGKTILKVFSRIKKFFKTLNSKKMIMLTLSVLLVIFLIIKYNCEKIHQDVLFYGSGENISSGYIIKSKIRNNCLYADIRGPISKISPFYKYEVVFYVQDKNGTTLGKSIIKSDEIFHQRNKHITFSVIIPNVTWRDRLSGLDIGMVLPNILYSKKYVNSEK